LPIFANLCKIRSDYEDLQMNVRSTAGQAEAARNAGKLHDWPDEAGPVPAENILRIFYGLQEYRAYLDWKPTDIADLATIAHLRQNVTDMQLQLNRQGHILYGGKTGLTPYPNPLVKIHASTIGSLNSLSRRLGLTTMTVHKKRETASRAETERRVAREFADGGDGDVVSDPLDRSRLM
jgi:hypothetical protein